MRPNISIPDDSYGAVITRFRFGLKNVGSKIYLTIYLDTKEYILNNIEENELFDVIKAREYAETIIKEDNL